MGCLRKIIFKVFMIDRYNIAKLCLTWRHIYIDSVGVVTDLIVKNKESYLFIARQITRIGYLNLNNCSINRLNTS